MMKFLAKLVLFLSFFYYGTHIPLYATLTPYCHRISHPTRAISAHKYLTWIVSLLHRSPLLCLSL